MHTLVERIFFVTCLQCNYKCHMQLNNVICNYFLVAYNTCNCIVDKLQKIFFLLMYVGLKQEVYILIHKKSNKSSLSILRILYNICSYAHWSWILQSHPKFNFYLKIYVLETLLVVWRINCIQGFWSMGDDIIICGPCPQNVMKYVAPLREKLYRDREVLCVINLKSCLLFQIRNDITSMHKIG
jgi:hypothetical protein